MKISLTQICLLSLCLTPLTAHADNTEQHKKRNTNNDFITLNVENDLFGGNTDRHYTNGVRLTYYDIDATPPKSIDKAFDYIPLLDITSNTAVHYSFGQNMYTPKDIIRTTVDIDDRPWSAFVYGSIGLTTLEKHHVDEIELTLGWIGPSALGEPIQKFVHKLIDSPEPKGWDTQLKDEPGLILSWQRRFPTFAEHHLYDLNLRFIPHGGVTLGNIYTHANAGITIQLSPDYAKRQDTPMRVRPSIPGSGVFFTPDERFSWSLFASLDNRFIARNIFLDGNTFRNSHHVDKRYHTMDASAGLSLIYDDIRTSYTINYRSKEYREQEDADIFGAISIGFRF